MSYEDLQCVDFVELVTEYLEGAMPANQRLVMELHLAFCSPCVDYLEQIRATVHATGAVSEEDVPPPLMESLLLAFRAHRDH